MEVDNLTNEEIEQQIELYLDRIETISDYISDTDDYSIKSVLKNQKDGYKQALDLLYTEKRKRKIKSANDFEPNIEIDPIGTKWVGKFNAEKDEVGLLIFYPFGVLKYENFNSNWKIDDGKLVLNINNGFCTFYGQIKNNRLFGNAVNVQDKEWAFDYSLVNNKQALDYIIPKNDDKKRISTISTQRNISDLGRKWIITNYIKEDLQKNKLEFLEDGILKIDNANTKWEIIDGRIIFTNNEINYNAEILQNKIFGLANNKNGEEWIFTGEFVSEISIPENSRSIKIKSENRGFGLMAANDETWNKFRLLDNGYYFEDESYIILTSSTGNEFKASKGDLPWEVTLYNRNINNDKNHYEILSGRIPDGGQFQIYRSRANHSKNEFIIGMLDVKNDGITFEIS